MHNFEEMDRRGTEDVLGHDEINHDKIDLNENPHIVLSKVRANNANRPIIGHFKIDILLVTETKIDEFFTTTQFQIDGFSPTFRLDPNRFGGGVMIYVRDHLLCVEIY